MRYQERIFYSEMMHGGKKPLFLTSDLQQFLQHLHQQRDAHYDAVATLTVDSQSVDKDVEQVMRFLV